MKNNIYKNRYIIIVVIVLMSVIGITLFVGHNKQNRAEERAIEKREEKKAELKSGYEICLFNIGNDYNTNWNLACDNQEKEANCNLPRYLSTVLNNTVEKGGDKCLETYKTLSLIELE